MTRSEQRLDAFTRQYIETALWSTTDESRDDGGDPLDDNYSASDIAPETMAEMVADCARFQEHYSELLSASGLDSEKAGHYFWLSRNGHGSGFFDENLDELQKAAGGFGEFNLYVGDDGLIYGQGPSTGQQQVVAEGNRSKPTFGPTAVRESGGREPMYHVIAVSSQTGKKTYMTATPVNHAEALIIKSKMTPRQGVRYQLEPVEQAHQQYRGMRDYEAVDNSGRRVAGPFKHYSDAKGPADQARGYVKYVPARAQEARAVAASNARTKWPDWMILESVEKGQGMTPQAKERAYELADLGYIDNTGLWKLTAKGQLALKEKVVSVSGAMREAPIPPSRQRKLPPHSTNALKLAGELSKRVGGDAPKAVPGGFRYSEQNESAQFTTFSPERQQRVVCLVSVFNVDGSVALNFFTGEELVGQYENIGHQSYDRVDLAQMQKDVEWVWKTVDSYAASWEQDEHGAVVEAPVLAESEHVPFHSWKDLIAYAQTGGTLFYKAPLDRNPTRLAPKTERGQEGVYEAHARSIRIWPYGSSGRGKNRTSDPFTADSGHLDRFSHPS